MSPPLDSIEFDALIQVCRTVNAHLDLDSVLESVMSVTTDVMHADASSLVLIDENTDDLLFHIAQGEKAQTVKQIRIKKGEGIVGWVIENGKPVVVNDVSNNPLFLKKVDEQNSNLTVKYSTVATAIKGKDKVESITLKNEQ